LLMLWAWAAPVARFSKKWRHRLLVVLDALGKWSLVDTFVMVLFLVAFRIKISTPEIFFPVEFGSFDLQVEPNIGFYLFLIATILSLVMSHTMMALYRHAEAWEQRQYARKEAPAVIAEGGGVLATSPVSAASAVRSHSFKVGDRTITLTALCQLGVAGLLLLAIGLVFAGAYAQSFEFQYEGAAGLVMPTSSFSLVSVGNAVSGGGQNNFGIIFIQVCFITFAIGMPIAQLVVLFALWCCPLPLEQQRALHVTSEVFGAWSALDVFIVSIITALLELNQFAQFIVSSFGVSGVINELLAQYLQHLIPDGNCTMVEIITRLNMGCWLLFGAALIALVVGQLVTRCAETTVQDRSNEAYGSVDVEANTSANSEPSCCLLLFQSLGLVRIEES